MITIKDEIGCTGLKVGEFLDDYDDIEFEVISYEGDISFWLDRPQIEKLIEHLQTVLK